MGVDLGGGEPPVAEQRTGHPDVPVPAHHLRGEGVVQHVRRGRGVQAGPGAKVNHQAPDGARRHALMEPVGEERGLGGAASGWSGRGAKSGRWNTPSAGPLLLSHQLRLMPRIRVLEKCVAERIAAGEVVERPASVVKELVENSLDAGARRVTVELENGGLRTIRVTDDGHGVAPDDVRLALQRFATSKIRTFEDLHRCSSLGFRGEALPSIAAVSRLEILTCEPGAEAGTRLRAEGGRILEVEPTGPAPGTRVTVRDLFFNTPARRKFLRSPSAETGQVVDLVGRLALTRPEVHFRLLSNGRELLSLPPGLDLAGRLARLWKAPREALVPVCDQSEGVRVEGVVALPAHTRGNRTGQILVVNGRLIRSAALSQALFEGFSPLVPQGRFPLGLLHLLVDPAMVDVNVHPTKAEVRFADSQGVFRAVRRAVARSLEEAGAEPGTGRQLDRTLEPPPGEALQPPWERRPPPGAVLELFRPLEGDRVRERPAFRPLGQLHRTYIVGLMEGELWVVDQHTAHERINYERLGGLAPVDGGTQGLTVPEVVELPAAQAAFLAGHREAFQALGFEVEPFGSEAFQLRSVPAGLPPSRVVRAFREAIEELAEEGTSRRSAGEIWERLRAMVACRSSVKAGDPLSFEEMERLVCELQEVEHSRYCPHGRPTRIRLDRATLERLFHR